MALLGGAAAAPSLLWPLAARAQPATMRRIGALIGGAETDPVSRGRAAAMREDLEQRGWSEGRNLRIDYRWDGGDPARIRTLEAELVGATRQAYFAQHNSALTALLE